MSNDFSDLLLNHSDTELIKLVSVDQNKYNPEIIQAAKFEITKRGIDSTKFEETKKTIETELAQQSLINTQKTSQITRLIHFVVDTISFWILSVVISIILGLIFIADTESQLNFINYLIYIFSFLSYYIFMEYKYQVTLGKLITKTKVVNIDGAKCNFDQIAIRTLYRLVPLDAISFLIMADGFHDKWAKTTVIKSKVIHIQENYAQQSIEAIGTPE